MCMPRPYAVCVLQSESVVNEDCRAGGIRQMRRKKNGMMKVIPFFFVFP